MISRAHVQAWAPLFVVGPSEGLKTVSGVPRHFIVRKPRLQLFAHFKPKPVTTKDAYSSQQMLPGTSVSFAELFSSHYKKLCLYAFQFIKDRDLVEDIVQDCFTKLWVKRDQLDFSSGISGYLYTMVRHGVYDFLREAGTHSPYYKAIELLADNSRTHELIVAETIQHIHQIKELLPPKCRDVFNLLFIEGKNNAETARELRITESTLRTQKAKALAFIRQRLNRLSALLIFFFAG